MLTADLVLARKKNGELKVERLSAQKRERAVRIAEGCLALARAHVGRTRGELDEAWDDLVADEPRKLAAGMRKLVEDACVFESEFEVAPGLVRRAVFARASAARRALEDGAVFDRALVLVRAAAELGVTSERADRLLFADLRAREVLVRAPVESASAVVHLLELGQAQAVLLRAVRVRCDVAHASPVRARALFARLKFHGLLFSAERRDGGGFRVLIDGPFSLFESVTRYGLGLALAFAALRELQEWELEADVLWGKLREPLVFRTSHAEHARIEPSAHGEGAPELSTEVGELLLRLRARGGGWTVEPVTELLDLPGLGVSIPDLVLRKKGARGPVYLEVLGAWSRAAVWKRVELVEAGLGARVIFAANARLRVSSEVLPDDAPSALYVWKRCMSADAILERAAALAAR